MSLRRLPAAAALAALAIAAPAAAAPPIMPLSAVRPGMQCTARTVLRGTEITSFDVEIVDVVVGDEIADQPLLLVHVTDPDIAATGIAEGFSGSPIYCPDADGTQRIAGAIAYGTGDYGNLYGLATPIQAVLGEPVHPPRGAHAAVSTRPLAVPLAVAGVDPAVLAPFARAAAMRGIALSSVPAAPLTAAFPRQRLEPGASLAAGLSSGAIALGAIGTVSYVDGARVWGFGHPLDGTGQRSLLLQDAYVYTVLPNPIDSGDQVSQKLAAPGHDLGTLTSDGRNGVAGVVGPLPPEVRLRVRTIDTDTGRRRTSTARVADETAVGLPSGYSPISLVGPLALAEAAYVALDGSPVEESARLCVRLDISELHRPARFCNSYVGAIGGSPDAQTAGGPFVGDLAEALADVDTFGYGTPHLRHVDVTLHIGRGRDQALLTGVKGPRVVHPGERVRLTLELRRYRGARLTRHVTLKVPAGAPAGKAKLRLEGTPADGEGEIPPGHHGPANPKTFAGLRRRIGAISRFTGVRFRLGHGGRQHRLPEDPDLRISGTASYAVTVRP